MKKYTLEQFTKKYENKRHISCGINYKDGWKELLMNVSYSQVIFAIRNSGRELDFIASK